jgi:hypothetical protein
VIGCKTDKGGGRVNSMSEPGADVGEDKELVQGWIDREAMFECE